MADPEYTTALAEIEQGGLHSLLPKWAHQATTYMSPPQVLRSVLRKPTEPAQASQWQFPPVHQCPGDESPTGNEPGTSKHWMNTRLKSRSKTGEGNDTGTDTHVSNGEQLERPGAKGAKKTNGKCKRAVSTVKRPSKRVRPVNTGESEAQAPAMAS